MINIKAYIKTHSIKVVCSLLAITMVAGISGCSSSTDDASADAADVPVKNATVIKSDEEKTGGNLNIYMPKGVATLNPFRTNSTALDDIYSLIYEKLIYIDSTNKPKSMLAESWAASADGMSYTVTLRNDVYFSNGAKMVSKDVIYTYNYIKSIAAGTTKYTDVVQAIASITEIDDTHFTVTGTKAGLDTLYALNFPVLCRSYNNASTPMGTGPYKVSSYTKDSKLVLVPNTKWWKPQPYIQTITAICYDNEKSALDAFASGAIDIINTDSVSSDIYRKSVSANRYKLTTTELNYLMINMTKSNLKNKVFRQALDYAMDKKKIINNVFISHADPVDQPLAPTDWRYSISYTQYDYDYDTALKLFNSLGITQKEIVDSASGLKTYKLMQGSSQVTLKLLIISDIKDTSKTEIANNLKSDLAKIGISLEITKLAYDKYITAVKTGDFDLALCNVNIKNDMDIGYMFTNNTAAADYLNYGKYYNSTLSSYISAFTSSTDEATILKNAQLFQQLFTEEVPFICLNFRTRSLLVSRNVAGITEVLTDNVFNGVNEWYIK